MPGEARNGGHPDWVLSECGRLRSATAGYLGCVEPWFRALAAELVGSFWKDGGPIWAVQVLPHTQTIQSANKQLRFVSDAGLPAFCRCHAVPYYVIARST